MRQIANIERQTINNETIQKEDKIGDINDHLPFLLEKLYEELSIDGLDISTEETAKSTLNAINKMIQSLNNKREIINRLALQNG